MLFFSEFSCPGRVWTEFGTKIFFLSFSASLKPFWIETMSELTFLIFWIFLLFFSEFFCPGIVWKEFGIKFFFLFLGLSHPNLAINNFGKKFFNFLIFFLLFSEFSYPSWTWTEFETKIFLSFSNYLIMSWLKIMPERGFLGFYYFFRNFNARVEYERNSGLKFFSIFFEIFLPRSSMNGILD